VVDGFWAGEPGRQEPRIVDGHGERRVPDDAQRFDARYGRAETDADTAHPIGAEREPAIAAVSKAQANSADVSAGSACWAPVGRDHGGPYSLLSLSWARPAAFSMVLGSSVVP
jgi:hypothetical protein